MPFDLKDKGSKV
ncbi:trans-sialidase, putative, partial [Trypanosoma cruzi]